MHEIIKRDRVRMNRSPAPAERYAQGALRKHESTARVVQESGRVVAIEFTCACGEKTLLELDHDGTATQNT